jgi:hypothetical protein
MKFPIKYFDENIIVNESNDCWALYKFKKFDYDFLNIDKKFEILNRLTSFLSNIGEESKVLIVPTLVDYSEYFEKIENDLDKNFSEKEEYLKEVSRKHLDMCRQKISYGYGINDYDTFIMVKLTKKFDYNNWQETLSQFFLAPIETISTVFGVGKEINKLKLEKYKESAREYRLKQSRRMDIIPATEIDIQWLIKRCFYRGLDEEVETWDDWRPYFMNPLEKMESLKADKNDMVLTLTKGELDISERRTVKVNHEDKTSYQTFLAITKMPSSMRFPGSEFLMFPYSMDFPVETLISINSVSTRDALKKLENKKRSINSQFEHIQNNEGDVPEEVINARENLDLLETELKSNNYTLSRTSFSYCIYGGSKEELEERVGFFTQFYKDSYINVERPIADQHKLFLEFIPGTGRYTNSFVLPVTPRLIASGIMGSTCDLGDPVGAYIGKGGILEKPVFLDLLYACQLNKPAAAFVVGAQGYGKTFNTNLLVYNHLVNFNTHAFIIDPKGDRKDWDKKLPELKRDLAIVELKSDLDKGKLDPFIIYKDNMSEAGELVLNVLVELFNINTDGSTYLALQDAVERVKISKLPCMHELVIQLNNCPEDDSCKKEAELLARKIANLNKGGLRNLLYSKGDVESALNFKKKINIIMIQNLKLPASSNISKKEYSSEEKLGTVLMLSIANFAKRFSQMDNSIKKIVVMDEAWALAKTKQGEDLFERLARTGRSLNTSCVFIGHSSRDLLSEGIRNSIRYKFVFNVVNREEAIRTLEFLNMDATENNIELLSSDERGLENGECLFSDAFGRIGLLKFDAVNKRLVDAFRTTPPDRREDVS